MRSCVWLPCCYQVLLVTVATSYHVWTEILYLVPSHFSPGGYARSPDGPDGQAQQTFVSSPCPDQRTLSSVTRFFWKYCFGTWTLYQGGIVAYKEEAERKTVIVINLILQSVGDKANTHVPWNNTRPFYLYKSRFFLLHRFRNYTLGLSAMVSKCLHCIGITAKSVTPNSNHFLGNGQWTATTTYLGILSKPYLYDRLCIVGRKYRLTTVTVREKWKKVASYKPY